MPANGGLTLRMRRYNPLPTSVVPLGNLGITPPPASLTAVNVDATMAFYGQYIFLNEQVNDACYKSALIDLECLAA